MHAGVRAATAVAAVLLMGTSMTAVAGAVEPVTPTGTVAAKRGCYVTAMSATIRSHPSSRSTAVGMAYRGDRCKQLRGGTRWTKVRMRGGKVGWVATRLLHTPDEDVHMNPPGM